jgi:short-subunit dehydrogenase
MESIRVDLAGSGVRALTVYPGFVKTEMTAKNLSPMPFLMELDPAVKVIARGIERGSPAIAFPFPMRVATALMATLPRGLYERAAGRRPKPKKSS